MYRKYMCVTVKEILAKRTKHFVSKTVFRYIIILEGQNVPIAH